jgi:hypothetical protein
MTALTPSQDEHLRRLAAGDRLTGPARVRKAGNVFVERPWGFASGARAHAQSIDRLAARGLVAISETDNGREAALV